MLWHVLFIIIIIYILIRLLLIIVYLIMIISFIISSLLFNLFFFFSYYYITLLDVFIIDYSSFNVYIQEDVEISDPSFRQKARLANNLPLWCRHSNVIKAIVSICIRNPRVIPSIAIPAT